MAAERNDLAIRTGPAFKQPAAAEQGNRAIPAEAASEVRENTRSSQLLSGDLSLFSCLHFRIPGPERLHLHPPTHHQPAGQHRDPTRKKEESEEADGDDRRHFPTAVRLLQLSNLLS
jgi:hypothetical protein